MTAHLHHTNFWHRTTDAMQVPRNPLPQVGKPMRMNGKDEGLSFALEYDPQPNSAAKSVLSFGMVFTTPERCREFFDLMQRALNCSDPDKTPEWAYGLMDMVTGTPSPSQRQKAPVAAPEAPESDWLGPVPKACAIDDPGCEACQ
jgi:hypothetical protein